MTEMEAFKIIIERMAIIEEKVNSIDDSITTTKGFIEQIEKQINPLIAKLTTHPLLKAFF